MKDSVYLLNVSNEKDSSVKKLTRILILSQKLCGMILNKKSVFPSAPVVGVLEHSSPGRGGDAALPRGLLRGTGGGVVGPLIRQEAPDRGGKGSLST